MIWDFSFQGMDEQPQQPNQQGKPTSDQLYLEKLQFNPELRKTWLNFFVTKPRVVALMILILVSIGLFSYVKLPRESDPEVTIPIAVVTTVFPGASPLDVEELVTKKIETAIVGLKGVDKMTSQSANSFSSVTVEFNASEPLDDSIRKLKDKITSIQNSLPDDATEPTVTEISLDDQPVLSLAMTGSSDGFRLRSRAEDLKEELEGIAGVREILISGGSEKEYSVAYHPDRLLLYGISADQASSAIRASNVAIPSGNFEGAQFVYPIRTESRTFSVEALQSVVVGSNRAGGVVRLRDIADVTLSAKERQTISRFAHEGEDPQTSVTLSLVKRSGSSILKTVDEAQDVIRRFNEESQDGVRVAVTLDTAKFVREDFDRLGHDFLLTFALVFAILFLIVGLKEAFVAGLAIPLVFFATFASLLAVGISLNFLSVFSLILSLGLLVDDAIVVVSATKQYLRSGKFTPEEAVLLVLNDFKVVLTTTTLTTVWAFFPLLFSTGIIGEYIKSIPVTVSITLMSSLFIALMINHPLAAVLERLRLTKKSFVLLELALMGVALIAFSSRSVIGVVVAVAALLVAFLGIRWFRKQGKARLVQNAAQIEAEWSDDELIKKKLREQGSHIDTNLTSKLIHGILKFDRVLPWYDRRLRQVLATKSSRRLVLATVTGAFVLAIAMLGTGLVKTEFFPVSDFDYVYVDLRAPAGTSLTATDEVAQRVEERLRKYDEIDNFATIIGRSGPFSQNNRPSTNIASITLTLVDKEERDLKSFEFATKLRNDLADIRGAEITVASPSSGPPSGAAFEAQVKGDDLAELARITKELKAYLASVNGVVNVDSSLKDTAPEYTFKLDPAKLELNGLNAAYVGSLLRMAIAGSEVSSVIDEGKEIKIVARIAKRDLPTLESVQNIQLLNFQKHPVFLKDVAVISLTPSVDSITRIDQKRTVRLTSGVDTTTNSTIVQKAFQKAIEEYQFPKGYEISYGGENEQNAESVQSVINAMAIALLLIVATLVIQFNSFKKAFIVLVTIPLALIGVFYGMALLNVALSFPGLIGVLALFGIVVKNAIILVDKMNLNIKSGIPFTEAIIDAGKSRLEAIFITSISTILGILPITLSNELWRSLGSAVIFGLMLSSFLTLFVVPVLFVSWIGEKERF